MKKASLISLAVIAGVANAQFDTPKEWECVGRYDKVLNTVFQDCYD